MSARLDPGVKQCLDTPSDDRSITLIVGVDDSESGAVLEQIRETGATIEDLLPCDYLALSIDERNLNELCDLDIVDSVEIEGEGETLQNSDF